MALICNLSSNCSITILQLWSLDLNEIYSQELTVEGLRFYAFMGMDVTFWCIVTYSCFFEELWPYVINKHGFTFSYITFIAPPLLYRTFRARPRQSSASTGRVIHSRKVLKCSLPFWIMTSFYKIKKGWVVEKFWKHAYRTIRLILKNV